MYTGPCGVCEDPSDYGVPRAGLPLECAWCGATATCLDGDNDPSCASCAALVASRLQGSATHVLVTARGRESAVAVARRHGIAATTYYSRIGRGMDPRTAATQPLARGHSRRAVGWTLAIVVRAEDGRRRDLADLLGVTVAEIAALEDGGWVRRRGGWDDPQDRTGPVVDTETALRRLKKDGGR